MRMTGTIAAVAFDFDGTLADTRDAVCATVEQTLDELGVPRLARAVVVEHMGLPLSETFRAAGVATGALDHAVQAYRRRFPDNAASIALFPEVARCLRELAEAGVPMGIASSRGRASLFDLVERLEIRSLFRDVLGEEDVPRKKPAPDLVLALSRSLGAPPSRMLVVGDTTYDVAMGRAAGAVTCGVLYGCHDAARLRAAEATFLVDSLAALPALVRPR
jgi:phosphoglycolate phosphatase